MDPIVSSRVPEALRNRVNARLKQMDSSPTELINKAYEYVDSTGMLPISSVIPPPGKRQLSSKQKAELQDAIKNETFAVPESFFTESTYDELLEEELRGSYEALL